MNSTPLTRIVTTEGAAELHVAQGVGNGCGEPPDSPGPPADASEKSAQINAQDKSSLFNGQSPLLVVSGQGGFAARIPHDTPLEPEIYVKWRALVAAGRLSEADGFCAERALLAPTLLGRLCHVKDRAVVKRMSGDYRGAYDLDRLVYPHTPLSAGSFRSRLVQSFARSHETLGLLDPAFGLYTEAHHYAECDPWQAAQVDNNLGRCYTAAGRPDSAYFYFDRAEESARRRHDLLQWGEIEESRALAYEAEERFEEAESAAHLSIQLIAPTGDRTALAESIQTWARVRTKR